MIGVSESSSSLVSLFYLSAINSPQSVRVENSVVVVAELFIVITTFT